ncbi:gluconokinase [Rhizobium sp. L1K21]|uniref:gluconokinase n=1 Tax=Rhizobium sp. L1K21 TaxID=2954933 RepID=UPI002093E971|nr:gluconokinase [Rhizobium sp. L1K21]MCO6188564.1 gluconokinase [Rhizobium sp. L1K21]
MSPARIVVMGVSGCGKTTFGKALAEAVGTPFLEGDDCHPPENVARMVKGQPLDDESRKGWLAVIRAHLENTGQDGLVVSCSALKRIYRDQLREAGSVLFVYLKIDYDEALRRVSARKGHYMPASLVESQFNTLEPPSQDELFIELDACAPLAKNLKKTVDFLSHVAF